MKDIDTNVFKSLLVYDAMDYSIVKQYIKKNNIRVNYEINDVFIIHTYSQDIYNQLKAFLKHVRIKHKNYKKED